ncbi:hypothetical protein Mp_2g14400 [Marchantia polymorpha subsp. ruderalis]|uniref:Reverse transcriptase zinc-binding domain-containing protein n=1 Tax=Marchantia polymorpha TaxID=3197 RepID=A0A2R6X1P0_MARPO|nr:hypothetical protein MARPO_0042s0067 [Marchantia polymorpha]BBN02330.1 hypothetical protein Mp_2g14400 [Marchantia polymorpha subsp. ruderalis]|eukprot:PTQ40029.1 hypothetical protein MARPO_0042s0067 [Marchantia polymorpha]
MYLQILGARRISYLRPGALEMNAQEATYAYTAQQGCHWFCSRPRLSHPISLKWRGLVPASYRPRKEATFLWSIYLKAIAMNHWRSVCTLGLCDPCPCCSQDVSETIHHAFFECEAAQSAWDFASTIVQLLAGSSRTSMPWERLTMEQCLLGIDLPAHLLELQRTWSLLCGPTGRCHLGRNTASG